MFAGYSLIQNSITTTYGSPAPLPGRIPAVATNTVYIKQTDFTDGPYVITAPGTYVLSEDVVFDPFPNAFEDVFDHLARFPAVGHEYVLGYFAAIIIYGENIVLDLNGHTIRQSLLHNYQQRFFALIELANRPFLPGQGPADFGSPIVGCRNVTIRNGVLGLSSHHGIHGNNADHVNIQNITIFDFEVAGISLNGCTNVRIERVDVRQNYRNIRANGYFSNAMFTIKKLMSVKAETVAAGMGANGIVALSVLHTVDELLERLRRSVVDFYMGVVVLNRAPTNPDSILYVNDAPYVTDGHCYGISLNTTGLMVNEYRHTFAPGSHTIFLTDVTIADLDCRPVEYRVLCDLPYDQVRAAPNIQTHAQVSKGAFGDIIDFFRCVDGNQRFTHVGNALVLPQVFLGTVPDTIREWMRDGTPDFQARVAGISVLTNLDIMAHVMKGTIGLFLSSVDRVRAKNVTIKNIRNRSNLGCPDYAGTNPTVHCGARTAGVLMASARDVEFIDTTIDGISSDCGEAYGYFSHGECAPFSHVGDRIGSLRVNVPYHSPTTSASVTPCVARSIAQNKI